VTVGVASKMLDSSKTPMALRALKGRVLSSSFLLITSGARRPLRCVQMLFLCEMIVPKHVQAAAG
jgi:hypothetical protein